VKTLNSRRWFTVDELQFGQGWGAGQSMWYMAELNQFIAQKLLPTNVEGMGSIKRQLRSNRAKPAFPDADTANTAPLEVSQQWPAEVSGSHARRRDLLQDAPVGVAATEQVLPLTAAPAAAFQPDKSLKHRMPLQETVVSLGDTGEETLSATAQAAAAHSNQSPRQRALLRDEAVNVVRDEEAILPLADEVGELYLYEAEDLKRIAPLWWNYTKQMRIFHETHAEVGFWYFFVCRGRSPSHCVSHCPSD